MFPCNNWSLHNSFVIDYWYNFSNHKRWQPSQNSGLQSKIVFLHVALKCISIYPSAGLFCKLVWIAFLEERGKLYKMLAEYELISNVQSKEL